MRKLLCFILVAISLISITTAVSAEEISIFINNQQLKTDVAPVFVNDRILVPVRAIFEALGAEVSWDDENFVAKGKRTGIEVVMPIDSNTFTRNGKEISLDVPATLINQRTMVPVRAVAESFNCTVDWIESFNSVAITTNDVVMGAITDFPPYCYKDENGEIKGKDIELIVAIADKLGFSPIFKEYEFIDAFQAIDNEHISGAVAGIAIDENRLRTYNCTDPYYHSKLIIMSEKNITKEDLKGKNIGVIEGSATETYITLNVKDPEVTKFNSVEEMIKALTEYKIDCIISEEKDLSDKTKGFVTNIFIEEDFGIYLDMEHSDLLISFNQAIAELKEEGRLEEIFN